MLNALYSFPQSTDYWNKEQQDTALKGGLANALAMSGLSMLAGSPTPYPQSFIQNLGQGLLQGYGAFQGTLANAQRDAEQNYWKNQEIKYKNAMLDMQRNLNDAHSKYYTEQAKRLSDELANKKAFSDVIGDITSKWGGFTSGDGNIFHTRQQVNEIIEDIKKNQPISNEEYNYANSLGLTPTNENDANKAITNFLSLIKPYNAKEELKNAYLRYNPDYIDRILAEPKLPKTFEEFIVDKLNKEDADLNSFFDKFRQYNKSKQHATHFETSDAGDVSVITQAGDEIKATTIPGIKGKTKSEAKDDTDKKINAQNREELQIISKIISLSKTLDDLDPKSPEADRIRGYIAGLEEKLNNIKGSNNNPNKQNNFDVFKKTFLSPRTGSLVPNSYGGYTYRR